MLFRNQVSGAIVLLFVSLIPFNVFSQIASPVQSEQDVLEHKLKGLLDANNLQKALPLAERIVAVAQRDSGPDTEQYARAIFNLAGLYGVTNNLDKAADLFIQFVEIFKRSVPENPSAFFNVLFPAVEFLIQRTGRHDVARNILEEISVLYDKRDEVLLDQRTEVYRRLAYLYIESGDHNALRENSNRVQELRALHERLTKTVSQEEAEFKQAVDEKKFDRAIVLARSLEDLAIRLYGAKSEQRVRATSTIGAVYERMNHYNDAHVWFERALEIAQREPLANSNVHAELLENAGRLLIHELRFGEAEEMYRQEYEMVKKLLGPKDPDTASVLSDLAQTLMEQGKIRSAIEARSEALEIYEEALGPDDHIVGIVLNNLGQDLRFFWSVSKERGEVKAINRHLQNSHRTNER
jgi:tetratricopeptide (TPR) repeat protein